MSWTMVVAAALFVAAWLAVAITAIVLSRRAVVRDEAGGLRREHDAVMAAALDVPGAANSAMREALREATMHPTSVRFREVANPFPSLK